MREYFRPLVQTGPMTSAECRPLAGGACWFDTVEVLSRDAAPRRIAAAAVPGEVLVHLTTPRAGSGGLLYERPQVMGILNVTPDSFSDGGDFVAADAALEQARAMDADGADIIDIGGESTRPGAAPVTPEEEAARVCPLILALAGQGIGPISVDTRNASTARAALAAGAQVFNDVSALSHDPMSAEVAAQSTAALCLMHAQGDPETMQANPRYADVLLDVYDYLAERIAVAEAAGVERRRLIVDPGIGFGKTLAHNLALLRGVSLFHGLGVPILVGASRKRFIGELADAPEPKERLAGSLAVAVMAAQQGVQVLRVHDVAPTVQALKVAQAIDHGI